MSMLLDDINWEVKHELPQKFWMLETDRLDWLKNCFENKKYPFVFGNVGTGKTVFMASLMKKYIEAKEKVKWVSYPGLIMKLRASFKGDEETFMDLTSEVAGFEGVLFLDDLGSGQVTEFVKEELCLILDKREQNMLPTVITSNLSLAQIKKHIDPRISSRIMGLCGGYILKFEGKDRRGEGNEKGN